MICSGRQIMRTTLNLDSAAMEAAMEVSPGTTKTEIINEALREYARRRRQRQLLELEGKIPWEGDLDELRLRRPAS
jgi:Arc/MetJ family transcription regulator